MKSLTEIKATLINELKSFGLNPQEWSLANRSIKPGAPLLFCNSRQEDFLLLGYFDLKEGQTKLMELNLASL